MRSKILFLVLMLFSISLLTACNDSSDVKSDIPSEVESYRIRFFVDDELYHTVKIDLEGNFELPEAPTKEGYTFAGWVSKDGDPINFSDIKKNMSVYAKFVSEDGETEQTPSDHVHEYNGYKTNSTKHWQKCTICNETTEKENHYGGVATDKELAKCQVCGVSYGDYASVDSHKHSYNSQYYSDENGHWQTCSCGEESYHENHFGGIATETERAKCLVCNSYYGDYKTPIVVPSVDTSFNLPVECSHYAASKYVSFSDSCTSRIRYYYCSECNINTLYSDLSYSLYCDLKLDSSLEYIDAFGNSVNLEEFVCQNCGLIIVKNTVTTYGQFCSQNKEYIIYSIFDKYGNLYIKDLSYLVSTNDHNLVSSNETLGNCELDGYNSVTSCTKCMYVEKTHFTGHYTETKYDTVYNSLCSNINVIYEQCIICDTVTSVGYDSLCNFTWVDYYSTEYKDCLVYTTILKCNYCQMTLTETNTRYGKDENCFVKTIIALEFNGSDYKRYESTQYNEEHLLHYEVIDFKGSCDLGYDVIRTCHDCDYSAQYGSNIHNYSTNVEALNFNCGTLYLYFDGCIACHADRRFSELSKDFSGWSLVDSNNDYEYYKCKKGCCEHYVYLINTTENGCMTEYTVEHTYYTNGQLIKTVKVKNYDEHHNYVYTPNWYGNSCHDGYDLITTCSNCDFREENIGVYDHFYGNIEEEYEQFCGYLSYYKHGCLVCGMISYEGTNDYNSWYLDEENSNPNHEINYCINGCCTKEIYRQNIYDEYCNGTVQIIVVFSHEGVEAFRVYEQAPGGYHDYQISYEMLGDDCSDGYYVHNRCSICGEGTYYTQYGHITYNSWDNNEVAGYCGSGIYSETCEICNEVTYSYMYSSCSWEYHPGGTPFYECLNCNAIKYQFNYTEECDDCHIYEVEEIKIIYNGETVLNYKHKAKKEAHNFIYTPYFYGNGCYDGYDLEVTCEGCDYYEKTYNNDTHLIVYNEQTYDELCYRPLITTTSCRLCDYEYESVIEYDSMWQGEMDATSWVCHNGCCEKVFTVEYELDENCYAKVKNITSYYHNGEFVAKYTRISFEYKHDLNTTYTMFGKSCLEGYEERVECMNGCGYLTVSTSKGHKDINEYYYVFECGTGFAPEYCVVCNEYITCYMVHLKCDVESYYDENGNLRRECKTCGGVCIIEIQEVVPDGCYTPYYEIFTIIVDNEIVLQFNVLKVEYEHEYNRTFINHTGNCSDGYRVIDECIKCGFVDEYEKYWHIYTDVSEIYTTPCGEIEYFMHCCEAGDYISYQYVNVYGIDWQTLESTEEFEHLLCVNGCCEYIASHVICDIGNCQQEVSSIYRYYVRGEEILFYTSLEIRDVHTYEYSYPDHTGSCNDSYTVVETCAYCDYYNYWTHSGHRINYETVRVDMSCGYIEHPYSQCEVCGHYDYSYANTFDIDWHYIENTEELTHEVCSNECCELIRTYTYTDVVDCKQTKTITHTYLVNGEVVYSFVSTETYDVHNFEYSYLDHTGNCNDGYTIVETCANCDYYNYWGHSGHRSNDETVRVDMSCGYIEHYYSQCEVCGHYDHNYANTFDIDWHYIENTEELTHEVCSNECCELIRTFAYTDVIDCKQTKTITHTYLVNGEVVYSYVSSETYDVHNFEYSYLDHTGNCNDGYTVIQTCTNCNYYYSYKSWSHNDSYSVELYTTNCGQFEYCKSYCDICNVIHQYEMHFFGLDLNIIENNEEYERYACENGCCECIARYYYSDLGNCEQCKTTVYSYLTNGEEIFSYSIVEPQYVHEYQYSYPDYTGNCYDEHTVIETCANCDYYNNWVSYSHDFIYYSNTYTAECGLIEHVKSDCKVCGLINYEYVNSDITWICVEDTEEFKSFVCGCEYGCSRYEVRYTYGDVLNCMQDINISYSYYIYGTEIINFTDDDYAEKHNIYYVFTPYSDICADGFDVLEMCRDCFYNRSYPCFESNLFSLTDSHYYMFDTTYVESDGFCGFGIKTGRCILCDYYAFADFEYRNCDWESITDENGVEIRTCSKCDAVQYWTRTYHTDEDACPLRQTLKIRVVLNDEEICNLNIYMCMNNHTYEVYSLNYEGDCEIWHNIAKVCKYCNHTLYEEHYGHYINYETTSFSGCHEVILDKGNCVICKDYESYSINESSYNWSFYSGENNLQIYICENGCCEKNNYYEEERISDCIGILNWTSVYKYLGEEIAVFTYKEIYTYHQHEEEIIFYGETCLDGLKVINYCLKCEEVNEWEYFDHSWSAYTEIIGRTNYCGITLEKFECGHCDEQIIYSDSFCNWVCDWAIAATNHYICSECGAEKTEVLQNGYDENGNYVNECQITITFNDEELVNIVQKQ